MKNHTRALVTVAGLFIFAGSTFGQDVRPGQPGDPLVVKPGSPDQLGLAPKLVLHRNAVDFGKILDDKVTPFQEVPFTNEGQGTLIIKDLHASCGCTVGQLDKRTYEPGESGVIRVQFKPQGKSNLVRQTVTLSTNDPSLTNFETQISVQAFVMPIVRVDPGIVNLGVLRKGEFVSNIFSVIGLSPDFEVVGVEVIGGKDLGMSAEVLGRERVSSDEGREGWTVEVEVLSDGSAKPGAIRGHIRIYTNDARRESVSVNLQGQVLGDIAVSEPQIRFGSLDMGESFERTLRVESRSRTPFKILGFQGVSNLEEEAGWTIIPQGDTENPFAYLIQMNFSAPDRPGVVRGTTIMTTDVEDETRIQLLFFGMIRPPVPEVDPNAKRPEGPDVDVVTTPRSQGNKGGGK